MNDIVSGADLLAKIKPKLREKACHICMSPELIDEWEDLNTQLIEAQSNEAVSAAAGTASARGAGRSSKVLKDLAQKVRDVEDRIEAADMRFVIRALPKDRYQALCEENPPRKDDQIDQFAGYNRVSVSDAAVRLGLLSPIFEDCTKDTPAVPCPHTDCGSWQQFVSVCSLGEWAVLRDTADEVNGAVTAAPKSLAASRILDKAATTSKRPAPGG